MCSLISIWINGWVNNREAGDLRRYRAHYDVIVMLKFPVLGYKLCWHDPQIQHAGASKDKQIVQIRIQVSRVEAVSILVDWVAVY